MRAKIATFSQIPFVRDVATMQVGRLITIGCGFITSIVYVRYLGLAGYGEYAVVLAFVGTFGVFTNLGQQATLTTFLAESYGRKDAMAMAEITQYYFIVSTIVIVLLGILTALAPTITSWIYHDPHIGKLARLVFLSSIFEVAFSYYAIVLQIVREIKTLTVLENTKIVVQVGIALLLLILGYGVAGILYSSLFASITFCILTLMRFPALRKQHVLPTARDVLAIRGRQHFWKFGKDGIWIAIDKNVGNLYPTIFLFALSTQAPQSIVGLLRLAFKLADLPASFALNSVSRLANTVLSTLAGRGGRGLRQNFIRLVRHTFVMHTAITAAGMVCVPILLPYVYGSNFNVALYPFLIITLLQLIYGFTTAATPILRIHSRIYLATIFNGTGMVLALTSFSILRDIVAPTRALYIGLFLYHATIAFVLLPTYRLLRTTT